MNLFTAYLSSPKVRRTLSIKPGQQGFSLIELVVVIAILAILAAVAIPAFLNIQKDGQINAAKNTLAQIVKECAVSDARELGTTFASAKSTKANLVGYNLKATTTTTTSNGNTTTTNNDTCYAAQATSQTAGALPDFSIVVESDGTTKKDCKVNGGYNGPGGTKKLATRAHPPVRNGKMKLPSRYKSSSAYTLLELVVVISILGILAGLGYPWFLRWLYGSQIDTAKSILNTAVAECLSVRSAGGESSSKPEALNQSLPGAYSATYDSCTQMVLEDKSREDSPLVKLVASVDWQSGAVNRSAVTNLSEYAPECKQWAASQCVDLAEWRRLEEERIRREEEERRIAEENRLRAEEEARLRAEAEAKRLADEAEAQRIAQEKRLAEEAAAREKQLADQQAAELARLEREAAKAAANQPTEREQQLASIFSASNPPSKQQELAERKEKCDYSKQINARSFMIDPMCSYINNQSVANNASSKCSTTTVIRNKRRFYQAVGNCDEPAPTFNSKKKKKNSRRTNRKAELPVLQPFNPSRPAPIFKA